MPIIEIMTGFFHSRLEKQSFSGIKKALDPSASYIIFENNLNNQGPSIFDPLHRVYGYLKKDHIIWQQVLDKNLSREYLVIKLQPGKEDQALGRAMGYGFPEDIIYYLYKAEEEFK